MHRKIYTLCILATLILLSRCGNTQRDSTGNSSHYEYYSTIPLRESPYPDWRGVVPISAEQASKRNHYRFEYNSDGQLMEISFQLGEIIILPNHTANYLFRTPVIKFEYDRNNEIRTFYDKNGNQTTSMGVWKEVYKLDANGRKVRLTFHDDLGNTTNNDWGIASYTWQHLQDGSVLENRFNSQQEPQSLRPGFQFFTVRLFYEQNGMLALMQNVDKNLQPIENESGAAQDKLVFDSQGRWLGWKVLNANGELVRGNGPNVAYGINATNNFGYEIGVRYEDEEGNPIESAYGFGGSVREYDAYGNYSKTWFVDIEGIPAPNADTGYTYTKYTFSDDHIDLLEVALLDQNNEPTIHKSRGFSVVKNEYDQNHNLVLKKYLDTNGELINRLDNGIAYIEYTYTNKGANDGTRSFDKDGKNVVK